MLFFLRLAHIPLFIAGAVVSAILGAYIVLLNSGALSSFTNANAAVESDGLDPMITGEVAQANFWLTVAESGKLPECQPTAAECIGDTDFASVVSGILARCQKVSPAELLASQVNLVEHEAELRALNRACTILAQAESDAGGPDAQSSKWHDAVGSALSELQGFGGER